jgi:hypothetical protein
MWKYLRSSSLLQSLLSDVRIDCPLQTLAQLGHVRSQLVEVGHLHCRCFAGATVTEPWRSAPSVSPKALHQPGRANPQHNWRAILQNANVKTASRTRRPSSFARLKLNRLLCTLGTPPNSAASARRLKQRSHIPFRLLSYLFTSGVAS